MGPAFCKSLLAASLLSLPGCEGEPEALASQPLPPRPARGEQPLFRRVPSSESGVAFVNELRKEHVLPYLYNGAGVTVGDFDGDGQCDLYLVSQDGPNKLYRQTSPFRFEDVTASAGVDGGDAWGTGASFADIDRDGDLDLYVCNTESPNKLYVNQGDGTFVERATAFGLAHVGASTMPAFADYDNDGDLDLYLLTNRALHPKLRPELLDAIELPSEVQRTIEEMAPAELRGTLPVTRRTDGTWSIPERYKDQLVAVASSVFYGGQSDRLFRNDGDRFTDVTVRARIQDQGMGLSATWWDYDDDGWLDLYVANDLESPDQLYRNRGDGTFEDVTERTLPHLPYFGMGSDAADIDNDGDLDLLAADMAMTTHYDAKMLMGDMGDRARFLATAEPPQIMRNALFVNSGTGRFLEAAYLAGVAKTDWTWAVKFADLDGDGWQDLFVTNGIARFDSNPDLDPAMQRLWNEGRWREALDLARNIPPLRERNLAFQNRTAQSDGAPLFEDMSADWGLDHEGLSNGAAWADFDRDGDLDLVVNDINGEALLYENRSSDGHRVVIELRGSRSERFGLGSRVEITAGGIEQTRLTSLAHGYLSTDEPLVYFGVGAASTIERLAVHWPSGSTQVFLDLSSDQRYVIREPLTPEPKSPEPKRPAPWFEDATGRLGLRASHREQPFDDFSEQPLLPHKHSQLGPGMAWGDVDGDGREDLFLGGARGSVGRLFVRRADDSFEAQGGPWQDDVAHEDLGILWFDHDADGDLDLYIVSGGVEVPVGDVSLRDRLYVNDGGRFSRAPDGTLPDLRDSGSCVCAADYDGDGDLDLFVGSRVVPGRYPSSPASRLLRNDGGRFVDATAELAPGLLEAGLVTAALWTDVDADGNPDLLVAAHWKPVQLFANREGRLVDATAEAGLDAHRGWWNGLAGADLDADGDIDYVATNIGLNTKYHADAEHPARIYADDFDSDGVLDVVEAKYEGDRLLPVRGRSCSSRAMPFLAEKFSTFDAFARASLTEIYTLPRLEDALALEATELAHVTLINDGSGRFEARRLPNPAQIAPAFGVALADFDGDGTVDAHLSHNFFSSEPETGRMGGGLGLLLRNRGDATFAAVAPAVSGIVVPGDGMALCVCDVDQDGWPDLSVATNDGPLYLFRRTAKGTRIRIRLVGPPGNPTAIGARISIDDGPVLERHAGSGYLGQSVATVLPPGSDGGTARIRWPDGRESRSPVRAGSTTLIRYE